MSTNYKTILNDMKSSVVLAKRNVLSYFLANLGMLFLMAVLIGIVAIPLVAIAWVIGFETVAAWFGVIFVTIGTETIVVNPIAAGIGGFVFVLVPLISLFLIVVGSIFGISKEIVETGTTRAESAFSWFRHKFLTFGGAGAILSLLILGPMVLVVGLTTAGFTLSSPLWVNRLVNAFIFVWAYITIGLTFMVFPAITQGRGVQAAFKESFHLATSRFDRVFGLVTGIVLLGTLMFSPAIIWGLYVGATAMPVVDAVSIAVATWTVIAALLWIFLLYPMVVISACKLHAELTGARVYEQPKAQVPMV